MSLRTRNVRMRSDAEQNPALKVEIHLLHVNATPGPESKLALLRAVKRHVFARSPDGQLGP